ncbi:hypothetical protein, partial [Xanthomonas citri]
YCSWTPPNQPFSMALRCLGNPGRIKVSISTAYRMHVVGLSNDSTNSVSTCAIFPTTHASVAIFQVWSFSVFLAHFDIGDMAAVNRAG